ncbi:ABC transporter ATP-binding protein [Paraeggerthella hongkongensis]|uniref:ABC transporter ATP-binding protein n=1 Tax=Paraeggerthella sp. TaxID=2897350 RepID=UPI000DF774F5|nr:ABC transporter ATP-binding protein [Paraeggerthella hongkongensis]
MMRRIQHACALSPQGARDLVKACLICALHNVALMIPIGVLYFFVCDFMDTSLTPQSAGMYIMAGMGCLALIALTYWWQYNATFLATYVESGVRRIALAEKLRSLPLSFFGKKDLSDLTSTIMADCTFLEQSFSHFIPEFVGAVISTVLMAIGLFVFDWRMALVSIWVIPVSFAIVVLSVKMRDRWGAHEMSAKMAAADGIQEALETMRDLRSCNAREAYLDGLDAKFEGVEKRAVVTEFGNAAFVVGAQMVLKLGIPSIALVGLVLMAQGNLSIPAFFMFLLVASRLFDPLQITLQNLSAIIATRTNVARMNEVLDHEVQVGSKTLTNQGFDIVFDRVGFSYNDGTQVLEDVSFAAEQGKVTALIGPSGGGKTTVSRLAARFWDASLGSVSLGGMDVTRADPEQLLGCYSIVFQDVTLFNNSVLENIRMGRKGATDEEVMHAADLANCPEFVDKLPQGWSTDIGENGCELSGGQRQRISIARAFLKNAPVLLLDEATASLDVDNEILVQESLSRLAQGRTVLMIAHRMRTIASADKIVVLADGTVAEEGSPEDLLKTNGIYARMAHAQGIA